MGMEKLYRTVRHKLGIDKEQMKQEVAEEVSDELAEQFAEEVSYIEAQMKEYEQFVAEVNHMMSQMRKDRIQQTSSTGGQAQMEQFEDDLQPLKSKLKELEESMQKRLDEQKAYTG